MAVRLQGAKRHAAERGELRLPLPVGLVYDADGNTIIDPDEEVQAAIDDVFKAFWQTGSAYGVVGAFAGRRFPRRAYGGAWAGELRWGRLTHARVIGVLSSPATPARTCSGATARTGDLVAGMIGVQPLGREPQPGGERVPSRNRSWLLSCSASCAARSRRTARAAPSCRCSSRW